MVAEREVEGLQLAAGGLDRLFGSVFPLGSSVLEQPFCTLRFVGSGNQILGHVPSFTAWGPTPRRSFVGAPAPLFFQPGPKTIADVNAATRSIVPGPGLRASGL